MLVVLMFLLAIGVHTLSSAVRSTQGLSTLAISTSASLMAMLFLSISAVSEIQINWPTPALIVLRWIELATFNLNTIQFSCIHNSSLFWNVAGSVSVPAGVFMSVFTLLGISYIVHPFLKTLPEPSKGQFKLVRITLAQLKSGPMCMNKCINACGVVCNLFYLSMVKVAVNLFNCHKHPSGTLTLKSHPYIICYRDEWMEALPLGIAAVVVYVFLLNGLLTILTLLGPRLTIHPNWAQRLQFLFVRFRPQRYYWNIVLQLRNTLVLLPVVVFVGRPGLQVFLTEVILIVFLTANCICRPWKHWQNNLLESLLLSSLQLIVLLVALYTDAVHQEKSKPDRQHGTSSHSLSFLCGFVIVAGVLSGIVATSVLVYIKVDYNGKFAQKKREDQEIIIENMRILNYYLKSIDINEFEDVLNSIHGKAKVDLQLAGHFLMQVLIMHGHVRVAPCIASLGSFEYLQKSMEHAGIRRLSTTASDEHDLENDIYYKKNIKNKNDNKNDNKNQEKGMEGRRADSHETILSNIDPPPPNM
eukprot:GHVR01058191.1.p1 GENE.GHVR01058191.1~~GHVR01058191.1.p1  ORF type:complete len:529 (+),score=69.29 GHVR01058191.1:105-1691(+)